jgi:hypothetical protein
VGRLPALLALVFCCTLSVPASAQEPAAERDGESAVGFEPNQQNELRPVTIEVYRPPGFLSGSTLAIKPRAYYLNRNRDANPDNVGFALGGSVEYRSGWWEDRIQVGATLFTSQDIYGPEDKDGTLLFKPGPEGFTVLGEAQITLRFADQVGMRFGRQFLDLPYLGKHDIRMVPNTFEAIAVGNTSPTGLAWIGGYVDAIKRKNDDDFVPMSVAAGADGSDDGVAFGGVRYIYPDGTQIAAVNHYSFNTFNTFFAKAEKNFFLESGLTLGANVQFTTQTSLGDELIGDFDTNMAAVKLSLANETTTWRIALSSTDNERGIQKPYGNPANYLSVIVEDFDRAGEDAWLIGADHDFGRVGIGDLSIFGNIVSGDTPDEGPGASADQVEYDFTLDYRMKQGWTDRIWLRVRAAYIDQDSDFPGADNFLDFRIIVNYDFDTL